MKELKYIALIPAYEPDEELKNVVNDLKKYGFNIVIEMMDQVKIIRNI